MHTSYEKAIREALADYDTAAKALLHLSQGDLHTLDDAKLLGELREMLAEAQARMNQTLMQMRARITTDVHIVEGLGFLQIGTALGASNNTPANWRNDHGPDSYYVIHPPSAATSGEYLLDKIPARQREVRTALSRGAVLVPARESLDLLTPEQMAQVDLAALYEKYRHTAEYARRPS